MQNNRRAFVISVALAILCCSSVASALPSDTASHAPVAVFPALDQSSLAAVAVLGTMVRDGLGGPGGYELARRRYQQGTVELLPSKQWRLRWREDTVKDDGTIERVQRKTILGTLEQLPTKQLARRAADAVLGRINSLDYVPGKTATVREFAVLYERDVLPMLKPSTASTAKSHLRLHINPMLGELPLDAVRQQAAQQMVGALAKKGISRKSIKNVLITVSSLLRTAREWGFSAGTIGDVRFPQTALTEEVRCFTADEVQRIIDAAPDPWQTLFATAAMTGLRLGELLGLRWQDVDIDSRVISVVQSVWQGKLQTPKTANSVRHVPIPEPLIPYLDQHRHAWKPNLLGLLWANGEGEPVCADNLRHRVLQPLLKRLGIPPGGFHAFRHLQGTLLVATGANPKVAQAQLGHSDVRTTLQLYAHVIGEDHRQAVEKVAALLRPVAPREKSRLFLVKKVNG